MKLLLDTHVFLWSLLEPDRLAPKVRERLESPECEVWLSPITSWEVMILAEKGRVELDDEPGRWLNRVFNRIPFRQAPITHQVAILSRAVRLPHQDPADRFLAATAKAYDLTLVTADEHLIASRECTTLANR